MSDEQLAPCNQRDGCWDAVALPHPGGALDSDEEVAATPQEMDAAQRQWEKTQRRHFKPIKRRTHKPAVPTASLFPLPPQPSAAPAGKDNRASVFATWLVQHYGEQLMRGHSRVAQPTTVPDWVRFSAHSLFLYPRIAEQSAQPQGSRNSEPPRCGHGRVDHAPSTFSSPSECSVIDVAGGRGYLSAYLSTVYRVPTTVVDPRPLDLERWRTQYRQRCERMNARVEGGRTEAVEVPSNDHCDLITHLPTLFPASLLIQPSHPPPSLSSAASPRQHPAASSFPTQPTVHPFPSQSSAAALFTRLSCASLLVGLHPDGATEALVDFALAHRRPFAVVPCCVFAEQFRERKLMVGNEEMEVRSYDAFVEYLRRKDPRIGVQRLPFQGRNAVLYMDPPGTEL